MNVHISTVHEGERPFKCIVCEATFFKQSHLTIHIKGVHDEKKFQCHVCGSNFSRQDYLKKHVLKVHEGIKQIFKCEICNELKLKNAEELEEHIEKMHKGAETFPCPLCEFKFYSQTPFEKT